MADHLVSQSKKDITKGSKSFSLASLFFSRQQKEAAWLLYAWCRYCDDVIDHSTSMAEAQAKTEELISETQKCYLGTSLKEHPWSGLNQIIHQYKISQKYPLDLLRGFKIDADGQKIKTIDDLLDYCYCVAGTVGLMMCHIMNVDRPEALKHAVDLGHAMQITNILRDIREDHLMGRLYLPEEFLAEENLNPQNFFDEANRPQLKKVADRLNQLADRYYVSGLKGLMYLPWRSAWAVSIALFVYRDIGRQVKAQGISAFDQRTVVSGARKFFLLICASLKLISTIPARLMEPWNSSQLNKNRSEL
ncbi:MAG: phytoene/squalene synthase family protein [Moraxellaceae bacterium]|nr:phytoene/squalene synthase family protein [Pseudobdellovibrionaceae bacterium]